MLESRVQCGALGSTQVALETLCDPPLWQSIRKVSGEMGKAQFEVMRQNSGRRACHLHDRLYKENGQGPTMLPSGI